jgi:hypothetical protein
MKSDWKDEPGMTILWAEDEKTMLAYRYRGSEIGDCRFWARTKEAAAELLARLAEDK